MRLSALLRAGSGLAYTPDDLAIGCEGAGVSSGHALRQLPLALHPHLCRIDRFQRQSLPLEHIQVKALNETQVLSVQMTPPLSYNSFGMKPTSNKDVRHPLPVTRTLPLDC